MHSLTMKTQKMRKMQSQGWITNHSMERSSSLKLQLEGKSSIQTEEETEVETEEIEATEETEKEEEGLNQRTAALIAGSLGIGQTSVERKELREGILESSLASNAERLDTKRWTVTIMVAAEAEAGHLPQDLEVEGEEDLHQAPIQEIEETKREATAEEAEPLREKEEAQRREEVQAEVAADQEAQETTQQHQREQKKSKRRENP